MQICLLLAPRALPRGPQLGGASGRSVPRPARRRPISSCFSGEVRRRKVKSAIRARNRRRAPCGGSRGRPAPSSPSIKARVARRSQPSSASPLEFALRIRSAGPTRNAGISRLPNDGQGRFGRWVPRRTVRRVPIAFEAARCGLCGAVSRRRASRSWLQAAFLASFIHSTGPWTATASPNVRPRRSGGSRDFWDCPKAERGPSALGPILPPPCKFSFPS